MPKDLNELLEQNTIVYAGEYEDYYYITVKKHDQYDTSMYKVNKYTGSVELIDGLLFAFEKVDDNKTLRDLVTQIDANELKLVRAS